MNFTDFNLCKPILDAIDYNTPSPIQIKSIPKVLDGRDLMAAAQTGTGKTAGFALPILEKLRTGRGASANQVRALVLTPTRELAAQVGESFKKYGKNLHLKSTVVFGGVKINPQMMKLRGGMDVLVATPGRLLDLYSQNAVKFNQLEILVLDEADRMLDMGFIHDIKRVIRALPPKRQTLLFSATFSEEIKTLAKNLLTAPLEISVSPQNTAAVTVKQLVHPVDKKQKKSLLIHLIREHQWQQVLVFSKTKHGANRLTDQLQAEGFKALAIHGNKSQGARTKALSHFKTGEIDILIATDIAARGLDIEALPQVVNFDLPQVAEDYVHRIGRTGRAGKAGEAFSLVSADEAGILFDVERLIKKTLPRELISGFEPQHDLPLTAKSAQRKPYQPRQSKHGKVGVQNAQGSQGADRRTRKKPFKHHVKKSNKKTEPVVN